MAENTTAARPALAQPGQTAQPARPIDVIRGQLDRMDREFAVALPQHIPVDRFKRIVLTAVNQNPDLIKADRKSLFGACQKAAQDGLFPDGREGALVIFSMKVKVDDGNGGTKDTWIKGVQWMPMVYGIIKKMRNSGELSSIVAHEVYKRDMFKYTLGDEERIEHEPYMGDEEPGPMIAVYAIAKLKNGTIQREVLTKAQVDKIRKASKSADNGPWVNWYEEMARKSAVRRLSKYLPMSTEIEDMLRRDDAISASADTMALNGGYQQDMHDGTTIDGEFTSGDHVDPETGEVTETEAKPAAKPKADPKPKTDKPPETKKPDAAPMQQEQDDPQQKVEPTQQSKTAPSFGGFGDE